MKFLGYLLDILITILLIWAAFLFVPALFHVLR